MNHIRPRGIGKLSERQQIPPISFPIWIMKLHTKSLTHRPHIQARTHSKYLSITQTHTHAYISFPASAGQTCLLTCSWFTRKPKFAETTSFEKQRRGRGSLLFSKQGADRMSLYTMRQGKRGGGGRKDGRMQRCEGSEMGNECVCDWQSWGQVGVVQVPLCLK